jgi:hypothetical protein
MKALPEYYAVLGLLPSADAVVVEFAYYALVRKYEDEKYGKSVEANEKLQQLNEAYQSISETAQQEPSETKTDFAFAVEYYPDLSQIVEGLQRISPQLASEYWLRLLSSRDFGSRHELATLVEASFFNQQFGENEKIIRFARELIAKGYLEAFEELRCAVRSFGPDADPIIGRISGKHFVFDALLSWPCSEESRRILHFAVEKKGYSIAIDDRNAITLAKGTSKSFLRSDADIRRFGEILGYSS